MKSNNCHRIYKYIFLCVALNFSFLLESKSQILYQPYLAKDSVYYSKLNDDPFKNNISASIGLYGYMTSAASGGFGFEISPTIIIKKAFTLTGSYRNVFTLGEKFENNFYKNRAFNIFELAGNIHLTDKIIPKKVSLILSEGGGYRHVAFVPLNSRVIHSARFGITSLKIPLDFSSYDKIEYNGAFDNVYGMIDYYVGFIGYGLMFNNHAEYFVENYGSRFHSMQGSVFVDLMYSPANIESKITYSKKPSSGILNYHSFGFRLGLKNNLPKMKIGANFEIGYFPGVGSSEPLNDVYVNFSFFYVINGTVKFLNPR
jgi:hypothetical protein